MQSDKTKSLITYLSQFVTRNKLDKIAALLPNRMRHVTVVLEHVSQPPNISAIMRSMECFGVQDVHIIEGKKPFQMIESIAMGATQWLNLHRYHNTKECYDILRKAGCTIAALTPRADAQDITDVSVDKKVACVFGTELVGLTDYAIDNADLCVKLPMFGFTESFNVSVSVALTLQQLVMKVRRLSDAWQLSEDEQRDIKLSWLKKLVRGSDQLEERFLKEMSKKKRFYSLDRNFKNEL